MELLAEQNKYSEAENELKIAVAELKKAGGKGSPLMARALASMAEDLAVQGRHVEMIPLLKEIVAWQESHIGPDNQGTARSMFTLVKCYHKAKDFENGISLSEELLKRARNKLGANDGSIQTAMFALADSYLIAGDAEKALPLIEKVRASAKGEETIFFAGASLLAINERLGKSDAELIALADKLVAESQKLPKDDDDDDGSRLTGPVQICLGAEAYKAAELLARECARIRSKVLPADSWRQFGTKVLIGRALYGQKKFADAEPLLVEGYEGMKNRRDSMPPDSKRTVTGTLEWLVEFYEARGEAGDAEKAAAYKAELEDETKAAPAGK
jgi:hypothetical protein